MLYSTEDAVVGVRTGDKGIDKEGKHKANFEPGVDLLAKITVLGEGPRGSLTKQLVQRLNLDEGREPQVQIRAERNCDTIRIWIEDNGIGVPPEHHDRIFGLFQRLHRPDQFAGTGVGLAIVKRAMEKMGGRAGVESRDGAGSRFWIDLRAPELSATKSPDSRG